VWVVEKVRYRKRAGGRTLSPGADGNFVASEGNGKTEVTGNGKRKTKPKFHPDHDDIPKL